MKGRSEEIISKIIRLYTSYRYPVKMEGEFNAWFASNIHRTEKDNVLKEIWEETVAVNTAPDRETDEAFRKLSARLGIPSEIPEVRGSRSKPERRKTHKIGTARLVLRIAAVLIPLFVLAGATFFFFSTPHVLVRMQGPENIHITATSAPRRVMLPDSSILWINKGGGINYKRGFSEGRVVELEGEAYFDVASNAEYPFRVRTRSIEVTVLGTAFNVVDYPEIDEAVVSLYRGSVRVDYLGEVSEPGESRELSAGRELVYCEQEEKTDVYELYAVKPVWLAEPMEFSYAPLSEIFQAVAKRFGVEISTLPSDIPDNTLSVYLDGSEGLEETLFRLAKLSGKFSFEIEETKVVIRRNN